jgi:hypothetical protein
MTAASSRWAKHSFRTANLIRRGAFLCRGVAHPKGALCSGRGVEKFEAVFQAVCNLGRRDSRYRWGRCREWIKIKNPAHPAIERALLIALSKRQAR